MASCALHSPRLQSHPFRTAVNTGLPTPISSPQINLKGDVRE